MPSVAALMQALPDPEDIDGGSGISTPATTRASMRPVPIGRLRRAGVLGTLQAKIAAAYLFYWVRGWFQNAAKRERQLAETHWRTAVRVLDSMNYLRGATMKVGQTLASYPDFVPTQFVETLDQLHFRAPPMHWSLLREMVFNELGDEPEDVFAKFEKRAFAAASLGQVHGGRLTNGDEIAVKIQYPGIGQSISADFRNLMVFLLPGRLSADWENTKEQFDNLRSTLEKETDYVREVATLQKARGVFHDNEGIVIPRVFPAFSTARVLTMERIHGVHLDRFLASCPSRELRNAFAKLMLRAWYRLLYAGRLLYADFNPGNFLFMPDGRLGVIDFGCMIEVDEPLWDLFRKMDRPMTTGSREDRIPIMKEWSMVGDDPGDQDRLRLLDAYTDWSWRPRYCGGEFDFGEEAEFRRGIDLFVDMVRKRYSRARACTMVIARQHLGLRAILYQLQAKIDVAAIAEEEVCASSWDRSDYATTLS